MDQDHQERIRQRAHEIWESEGRPEGRDADHWTRAEEELRNQQGDGDAAGESAHPELEQTMAPAEAMAPPKKGRKSKSEPTPYLNDGP